MSDFKAKMHLNRFRLALPQTPLGEPTALPQTPSWNNGSLLLKKREGCWEGKGRRGSESHGREGREGKGEMGKEGREGRMEKGVKGAHVCIFKLSFSVIIL